MQQVNSTNTLYTPPVPCPWPYTIGSTSGAAHIESSLGQYSSATASMASSQPSTVSYAGSNHFSRPPVSGLPSVSYPAVPPRHLHASHYSPGFTDDVYDPYGISTNQYHGLAQESQAASAGYATQDSGRNWIPIVPNNRISYGGSNFDADPPLRYGSSGLSHINGSTATAVSSDGTSFFPGMNSLASSLPVPPPSGDRTLPNPAKRASLINYGSISQGILGESVPAGLPLNLNDKHGVPCAAPSSMVDGSQAPINSTSLSTTSASGPATNRSTSSPRGSQNTATFGYMSLSRSPASAPHVAPASAYESANLSTSTGSIESHLGLADPAFQNTLCIEDLITSHESPSNMYSYSLGKSGSIDHVGPEGPLVSGQTYTSLRQPRPQHGASYGALRDDTLDSSPHVPQRTSISSISNGRSY